MQPTSYRSTDPSAQFRRELEADSSLLAKAEAKMKSAATKPGWPKPPAAQAFHGIAGEIVRAIDPHTESDPSALLIQFLLTFGNAVGRGPHYVVEGDRHCGNLFAVIVGDSSKGRKGTSLRLVLRVMESVDPDWTRNHVTSGLASGEGLIYAVRDSDGDTGDRSDGKAVELTGVQDKRLLVVEAEFTKPLNVMERNGSTLSAVLRDSWDNGDLRVLTKNSPLRASEAHISILGHVTRGDLLHHLNSTEASNGFANRFLWVCAKRSKILPDGGYFDVQEITSQITQLRAVLHGGKQSVAVPRTDEAKAIWRGVYEKLSAGKPGLFGSVTGRAEAQVVRLSLIYALLDSSPQIREEHMLAALAVWDYCEASARYIFGDALGHPDADRIRNALVANPEGLTRTEIRDFFGRHKTEPQIDTALALLSDSDLARRETISTGGRPIELWTATEATK
ncbi:MAG TPA: DUF3987 domain-containing protein [Candidatus Limnocylindrales bacterium]|nr:DUF3987 domain-containing protein [Candidatus Limnocylindrales bacterium]